MPARETENTQYLNRMSTDELDIAVQAEQLSGSRPAA